MKNKYKTKVRLLLDILLEEFVYDLQLSNQRMCHFQKTSDFETMEMERIYNNIYKEKVEMIKELISHEDNSYSSVQYIINISYINTDGKKNI